MQIKMISGTYGRKINMGDFNSAHVEMTFWADLEPGEDESACATALREMARNHVMTELARLEPKLAAKVANLILGLPVEVRSQIENDDGEIPGYRDIEW
ncbi:MAG: hypothetical protein M9928_21850 [Anaerolineae bacterium]|nr:hypothetical protein [Anaerolineae bacterium]MCO5191443.1 hypothetical protein [Anaerolineae bacterium]MCO5195469.1 hypothetical protein [Anaerolineae bacterium]MCO5207660.1 hypothetical protein [Anaerolineae bacterium]